MYEYSTHLIPSFSMLHTKTSLIPRPIGSPIFFFLFSGRPGNEANQCLVNDTGSYLVHIFFPLTRNGDETNGGAGKNKR